MVFFKSPPFFPHLYGKGKRAVILKLACDSQKRIRSYIDSALADSLFISHKKIFFTFTGTLEKDSNASLAVTGCLGTEDIEITLLSSHIEGSSKFLWKKDGLTGVIKQSNEVRGNASLPFSIRADGVAVLSPTLDIRLHQN